jgi:hypothetical protein
MLALALFAGMSARAEDKDAQKGETHEGTVVSVTQNKLVMKAKAKDKDGKEGEEHTHTLAANAKVTCDGRTCNLEDLKPGTKIRVTTKKGEKDIATRVEALDKNTEFQKGDQGTTGK